MQDTISIDNFAKDLNNLISNCNSPALRTVLNSDRYTRTQTIQQRDKFETLESIESSEPEDQEKEGLEDLNAICKREVEKQMSTVGAGGKRAAFARYRSMSLDDTKTKSKSPKENIKNIKVDILGLFGSRIAQQLKKK